MSPFFTPSTAGLISSSILTNHCCLIIGSTVVLHLSCVPTLCTWSSTRTSKPCASRSATMAFLASYLSMPAYLPPRLLIVASSFKMLISGRLWRLPTSKSFESCAGVIFTTPVPNSISTYSSAIIGICLSVKGSSTILPTKSL